MPVLGPVALTSPTLIGDIAHLIRSTRLLIGWSQAELADRAGTSQSTISRIEAGDGRAMDIATLEAILRCLGLRPEIAVNGRHLRDRRDQHVPVHAAIVEASARALTRVGWQVRTEAEIEPARGWIDLVAYRPIDRSLFIEEVKTGFDDAGAIQRQLGFYERTAWQAARREGWRPARSVAALVLLDSEHVDDLIAANRELVRRVFPTSAANLAAWLAEPARPMPTAWAVAQCDPFDRRRRWLRPTVTQPRHERPAHRDHADARRRLLPGAARPLMAAARG